MTLALEAVEITKRFPGVLANDHVNFSLVKGEIHALLGENGAGKSTLMNILYGLYQPDEGEIRINESPTKIETPHDAIAQGIGMVHQHFMLVPPLTVTENIMLGQESIVGSTKGLGGLAVLDRRTVSGRILDLSRQYGLDVDPEALVSDLTVGAQQRVEIVKALYRDANILILDEPTAVLTPQEADELFVVMRNLVQQGKSIVFITHKLREVFAVADRISVMRSGQMIGSVRPAEATRELLAEMMVGRKVILSIDKEPAKPGSVVIEVENLKVVDDRKHTAVDGITLQVLAGEILGIAGVQGNGQTELAEALTGLRPISAGEVRLCEAPDRVGAAKSGAPRFLQQLQKAMNQELTWPMVRFASLLQRLVASVIDLLIVASGSVLIAAIFGLLAQMVGLARPAAGTAALSPLVLGVISPIFAWLYYSLFESSSWQATPGKRLGSLKVQTEVGQRLTFLEATIHFLTRLVTLLTVGIGYLAIAFTARRQALHDLLAKCTVTWSTSATPRQITEAGTAHIPEDRHKHGLVLTFPLRENFMLNSYYLPPNAKGIEINYPFCSSKAEELVDVFDVRTPSIMTTAGSLSGGNQQKVIAARELSRPSKLLIASQPTRGLDVGSIEFIHRRIVEARDRGLAVLLVSAELDEIMSLSDRIAVMYKGKILATLDARDATRERLGLLMAGIEQEVQP
jgi:ABC-type uncharacterized transport system ATPase subunit